MPRPSIYLTLLLLFLGLLTWWFRKRPPEPLSLTPAPQPAIAASSTAELPPPLSTDTKAWAIPDTNAWLQQRNRDATSLLAVWDMTGDETILNEAAENFPDNPRVSLAMLDLLMKDDNTLAAQRVWVDRLIQAAPDNALSYYQLARLQMASKDQPAAVKTITETLAKNGRPDAYERERCMAIKEGMLASGAPLREALLVSLMAPMERAGNHALIHPIGRVMRGLSDQMKSLNSATEEAEDFAILGLQVAEHAQLTPWRSVATDHFSTAYKQVFLEGMDPTTEIANTGRTAATELQTQNAQRIDLDALFYLAISPEMAEFSERAPVEVLNHYYELRLLQGGTAALRYSIEQMSASK